MHGPFPETLGQDTVLESVVFVLQEEDVKLVAQHWVCKGHSGSAAQGECPGGDGFTAASPPRQL